MARAEGRRSEDWIDLFGGFADAPRKGRRAPQAVDDLVSQVEAMLAEHSERGGVTASAKEAIDRSLDRITRRAHRAKAGAAPRTNTSRSGAADHEILDSYGCVSKLAAWRLRSSSSPISTWSSRPSGA
jgi:hypothetical protein